MNTVRMFLYAILGVVCLLLWNAWQADYPPTPTPVQSSATNNTATSIPGNTSSHAVITSTPRQKELVTQIPNKRLISVHTDVLDVSIDTLGGNVVTAKLLKYPVSLEEKSTPVQLLSDSPDKLYIAASGVVSDKAGELSLDKPPQYTAPQNNYILGDNAKDLNVNLVWHGKNGITLTKTFTFTRGNYAIKVNNSILNSTSQAWNGKFFAELQRKTTEEDKGGGMFSFRTFSGGSISSPDKPYEKFTYANLDKENLARTIQGGWLAFQQRYFLSVWIPEQNQLHDYFSQAVPTEQTYVLGLTNSIVVQPNSELKLGATLYVGPETTATLKTLAPHLDLTIDYGWLWIISVWIFWLMRQIYRIVGNWGWSIIIVTILIKLAFYKFSEKSYRSMGKMKELAPRLQALKERFGNDKQKMQQATMELYKKEKVNPMGGCLPILIQIPVFIALYYVLIEAVELRQAPFMFWIHDLSARDPYYILPILMGFSMYLQQRLSPQPSTDPMQAKMMMFLPVIFTVFFLSFPAGLVLYWLVNNCLSVLQQWYVMRR
ncbi:MAG: membrane protein insertase YidC [Gammaproteobacteria bacterium]